MYQDVAYSKRTGFPTMKMFYGRIVNGKLVGKRFANKEDTFSFVAHKYQLPKKLRNDNVWTKEELEEIIRDKFPSMNENEKKVFMNNWIGQVKG